LPRTDRQVRPPTTPRPHRRRLARRGRHWRGVPQRALRGARDPVFSVPLRCRRDAVGDPLTAESGCPCHSRLHGPRSEPPLTSVSSIATVEMPSSVWTSSVKWPPQSILGSTISHPALSRTVVSTSDIDHLRCNVSIGGRAPLPADLFEEPNAAWTWRASSLPQGGRVLVVADLRHEQRRFAPPGPISIWRTDAKVAASYECPAIACGS